MAENQRTENSSESLAVSSRVSFWSAGGGAGTAEEDWPGSDGAPGGLPSSSGEGASSTSSSGASSRRVYRAVEERTASQTSWNW